MTNIHYELLPIEIHAQDIRDALRAQLVKGVALTDIAAALERGSLQKIREDVARVAANEDEAEYIQVSRAIHGVFKWLEYLVTLRKEVLSAGALPKPEAAAVHNIEAQLQDLLQQLDPALKTIVGKREEACKEIDRILKEAIEHMEKEISLRIKTLLGYRKTEEEECVKIQATFDRYFTYLRAYSDPIIRFLAPRMSEWNAKALSTGRGFLIDSIPDIPCSILFSMKGECRLIFEDIGHLLGTGLTKLVLRSICLPQGKIQALIKPGTFDAQSTPEQIQFMGMWVETEMLMKLKGARGIVALEERMAFEWDGEKKLFLAEDYYWDGTLGEYLKYPIEHKMESAKVSAAKQREILTDLLEGLVAIHKHQIVHHDIKPDNILLDLQKKEGAAVIADFHLATYIGDVARIEKIGFIPKWAPPEYAKIELNLARPLDEIRKELISVTTGKLDVWSMGLVFYALIAYEMPFWIQMEEDPTNPIEREGLFPLIAGLQKGWLPEHLKGSPYHPLLEKMLEPDPAERCTAQEALEILNRLP